MTFHPKRMTINQAKWYMLVLLKLGVKSFTVKSAEKGRFVVTTTNETA